MLPSSILLFTSLLFTSFVVADNTNIETVPSSQQFRLPSTLFQADKSSVQDLALALQLPDFVSELGMSRDRAVHFIDTRQQQRIHSFDPKGLDILERARRVAELCKRYAEILQQEMAMAVTAIQHVVDIIEHKHDYSFLFNDIAAFFGIFTYMGSGLDPWMFAVGLAATLGKFVSKEVAIQVELKANYLHQKELRNEQDMLVNINEAVDQFYLYCEQSLLRGTRTQLEVLEDLFTKGQLQLNTHDFELKFRQNLLARILHGRYKVYECRSKSCVGHPVRDPESGKLRVFVSDLNKRQMQYLDEVQVNWFDVYTGKNGWSYKNIASYKCVSLTGGLGLGVECSGHKNLYELCRKVVIDGKEKGSKMISRND